MSKNNKCSQKLNAGFQSMVFGNKSPKTFSTDLERKGGSLFKVNLKIGGKLL